MEKEFKKIREKIGSQLAVSLKLGVSARTIQGWEQGRKPIPKWANISLRALAGRKSEELKQIARGG